jgi:hypothetical protein
MSATDAHPSKWTQDELVADIQRRVDEIKEAVEHPSITGTSRDGLLEYVTYYWDDLPDSPAWKAAGDLLAGCSNGRLYLKGDELRRLARLNPAMHQIAELIEAAMDASFDIDGAYGRMEQALGELRRGMRVLAPLEEDGDA